MGKFWDRYGFVKRRRYLWQKARADTLSRKLAKESEADNE